MKTEDEVHLNCSGELIDISIVYFLVYPFSVSHSHDISPVVLVENNCCAVEGDSFSRYTEVIMDTVFYIVECFSTSSIIFLDM